MKLNLIEKALMNNPLRAWLQRTLEIRRLLRLGGMMHGGVALEIGCGRGAGIAMLFEHFGPDCIHAFDLDEEMVRMASRRLRTDNNRASIWVGSVEAIPTPDRAYDAVFDFGAIHHVVDWRSALREVYRVLKPGGRFYVEEILERYIVHPLWRRVLDHPQQDRFNQQQLNEALVRCGFQLMGVDQLLDLFAWVVADKPTAASQ